MDKLKPCPFCGGTDLDVVGGRIRCAKCSVTMAWSSLPERYVLVGDDIYRKIPARSDFDVAFEHWNRRADNG